MTSTLEGDNQIPLRVAFDDEVKNKVEEDGIEVLHKRRPDVEDKKKRKEEKDRKKKKDKNKEKRTHMEIKPLRVLPVIVEPEKIIDDNKPSANEGADAQANDGKTKTGADDGINVPDVPVDNGKKTQSDEEPKEPKTSPVEKKQEETLQDQSSNGMVIRAATRRDFCDDIIERDSRRNRAESNSSVISCIRQDRPIRDARRRKEMKDACTTTRDVLFAPCKFVGGTKESCRDLCERRKTEDREAGKCDKGSMKRLDKWCDARPYERERDGRRGISREDRARNSAVFNRLNGESTSSIGKGAEGRGDDREGISQRRPRESSTDEMTQLKNDLINLQTELDRLKECLKAAATTAENNKCAITKMKEHMRCNFLYLPDFTRIREKLKRCHLMKMKLCREFKVNTNRDRWRNDFECLMNELCNIRFELEKMRNDKT